MIPIPPHRPNRMFRWALALFLVLLTLFLLMAATARERQGSSLAENALTAVLYPFQVASSWVSGQMRGAAESVLELVRLRQENERLRRVAGGMPATQARLEAIAGENERLRAELGLRARTGYPLLAAEVIGRDPRSWFDTVVIDRGSRDGLRTNQAVINHLGLVGKVERVAWATATVRLVVDSGFAVSALNVRTQEVGALQGHGPEAVTVSFSHTRDPLVAVGDRIETSGLGGVIPPGLFIGTVEDVTSGSEGLVRVATVRPAVNANRLDVVQVVATAPEPGMEGGNP